MPHVFATLQGEKIRGGLPSPKILMEDLLPLPPQFASFHFTDELITSPKYRAWPLKKVKGGTKELG